MSDNSPKCFKGVVGARDGVIVPPSPVINIINQLPIRYLKLRIKLFSTISKLTKV